MRVTYSRYWYRYWYPILTSLLVPLGQTEAVEAKVKKMNLSKERQEQTQQASRAGLERLWSRCVLKVRQNRLY